MTIPNRVNIGGQSQDAAEPTVTHFTKGYMANVDNNTGGFAILISLDIGGPEYGEEWFLDYLSVRSLTEEASSFGLYLDPPSDETALDPPIVSDLLFAGEGQFVTAQFGPEGLWIPPTSNLKMVWPTLTEAPEVWPEIAVRLQYREVRGGN